MLNGQECAGGYHILFSPSCSLSAELQFVRSRKGKPQLVFRDYLYNLYRIDAGCRQVWVCRENKQQRCRARLVLVCGGVQVRVAEHNHLSHAALIREKLNNMTCFV
ncbi:hypothetical protein PR048_032475 [Dryococelus australis]|uniref:FLYWCH-type domain-containing protein n=1 Tax=Dryococelus australis TaxID=614101 RepID=A0ABQ9G2B0_9NEOP|nr:hypothetical protein PR048_032475 [Dryococelus australis]